MRYFLIILTILAGTLLPAGACAQEDYRFEAGGGIGMTGYLGDANTANLYKNPGVAGELVFRYIMNPRLALRSNIFAGTLSGDTSQMTDVLPEQASFKFSTTFFEASELFEFNFFNFGMGEQYRKLRRFTPYITGGLGLTVWTTEGYTGAAFTIPFGAGVKFKLKERLNIGAAFLMKKTFSDKLDGPALSDPHAIKSSFVKNTDWYSTLTVTLTYEFSKRCAVCNYKE
ncbi:MAG: outer membrane beta-barrel protein [Muribaculaceae bacterium]|nr:outer membrane beta-barrel protein [Muribaculaceae bacterium]